VSRPRGNKFYCFLRDRSQDGETRRLKAGQARYRADEPGPSPQTPEFFVIDQSVHAAPSGLRTSPDQDLESPEEPETGTGRKRSKLAWLFGITALVLGATFVLQRNPPEDTSQAPAKAQAAPMPVTVTEVSTRDVPIYLDGLGTVQASNTVAIRSQVDGKLASVNFVEGQQVKKGDTLAVVDQRPFTAVLGQAKAKRAEDEAQLVSDQKDLDRFQDLVRKGAGTQQAVDQQQAKVDNLKATIEADQAGIESAETQLSFATITAPIDGRVGFRQVDAGNIVHAGDATPVTVLTEIKPAWVIFTLPQRDLASVREAMLKGDVPALAFDQDNTRELAKGTLLLIDNQIDQLTSTIRLKASFPNEDERLWPGEFVRVRVLANTLKNAVTIPSAAIQRSSQGVFAWVVKPDNTVENRPIEAGPSADDMTMVTSGLKAGERIVVSGQYRLRPGAKVTAPAQIVEGQGP
jgi:multidrug efflux system membrane fusion protein